MANKVTVWFVHDFDKSIEYVLDSSRSQIFHNTKTFFLGELLTWNGVDSSGLVSVRIYPQQAASMAVPGRGFAPIYV
jgi:hypothetical protein